MAICTVGCNEGRSLRSSLSRVALSTFILAACCQSGARAQESVVPGSYPDSGPNNASSADYFANAGEAGGPGEIPTIGENPGVVEHLSDDGAPIRIAQSGDLGFDGSRVQPAIPPRAGSSNSADDASQPRSNVSLASDSRVGKLFGEVRQVAELPEARRGLAIAPASDAVFNDEATGRLTTDIGSLLQKSKSTHGVAIQNRTPIVSDTRVRGQRVGQVLASGSYWAPARMDLDTMMNKIDSRLIEDAILIKGPYSGRYGPGFRFVDLELIRSPRYESGPEAHGMSSVTYSANGEQWYGRQSLWGGSSDYGFFVSYGHRTGNDYETGDPGFFIPSSYKSRDLFAAIGMDLSSTETLEVNLLRLDQTDVEFPGLVYDLNFLVTDGYEAIYENTAPVFSDYFLAEVWYNRTRFEGDTLRPGKNNQIPTLVFDLESATGTDGFAITDGDALSAGYRVESRYFTSNGYIALGTDIIYLNQELNDIEPAAPANDNNFPIPRSDSFDIGIFAENIRNVDDYWTITMGGRIDGVFTDAAETVDGVPVGMSVLKDADLQQGFLLGAGYLTTEYSLTPGWSVNAGLGTSQRQPTLTELYAESAFIGSLQRGVTFLSGDPELSPERLYQLDWGTTVADDRTTIGAHMHHAWIRDYITYDLVARAGVFDGFPQGAQFVNTKLATLTGFETYGQYDVSDVISLFGTMHYTQGRDLTRNRPSRLSGNTVRSDVAGPAIEPLPGIPPLEARLGILFQDPSPQRRWGLEYQARIVDDQDRVAATLEEVATAGFTIHDIRGYWRQSQLLMTAGVENFGDRFYREHIDYRSGLGVFRPGVNFYTGLELNY